MRSSTTRSERVKDNPNVNRLQRGADQIAWIGFWIIVFTIAIGFALGLVAALVGGPLTRLGSGIGGLWGTLDIALILVMLLSLPSLAVGLAAIYRRHWRDAARLLAYVGPLAISFGYILIPHALDPCFVGVWGPFSTLGDIQLCERFGLEYNIHTRFHLLWHVVPTVVLVALYWLALRWLHPAWGAKRRAHSQP
jgi:hypothetical protein